MDKELAKRFERACQIAGSEVHDDKALQEAEQILRDVVEQVPTSVQALETLAGLLEQQGNVEEAAVLWQRVLDSGYSSQSANNLALYLEEKGEV